MKAEKTFVAVAAALVLVLAAGTVILGPAKFTVALGTFAVPFFAVAILLFGIVTVVNPHPSLVSGGPLAGRLSGLFNITLGLSLLSDIVLQRRGLDANISLLVRIAVFALLISLLAAYLIVMRRVSANRFTTPR